ncbi:MAG TPA: glucose 1-dehydrogenase [Nitrososphaerales archaeon]|nr:glucose 1-dehydrogenase [Nitrososphaerales archaeon]
MRLTGKVAIVTGASQGIGEAIAKLFVEEDARVVMGDIQEEKGRQLEKELDSNGDVSRFVKLDVSDGNDWKRIVDLAITDFGRVNILVNNAAISHPQLRIDQTEEDAWDKVMSVNAKGVFLGTKAVLDPMRKAGGGSIVNVSSQFGLVGYAAENSAYQASKGAIRILTKVTALQYAKDNIRANSLHPGPVDTPSGVLASGNPERLTFVLSKVPLGRIAKPREIANGALFLASDEASFMTGAELVLDGGWTAQ